MKRYAITVEYVGKHYRGSQTQREKGKETLKTVQSELEFALYTLLNQKIKTIFSGRTDRGVNAKGQVVHFDIDKPIVASRFINSLNGLLPKDISVSEISEVSFDFHAQKSARKRYYQYVFHNRIQRSAFDGDLLLVRYPLDIERMNKALSYLVGEHDFSSFQSTGTSLPSKVCFIYKAECQKLGDTVVFDIVGSRFLYNMVRIIVGTLLMIEKSNLSPEFMKELLELKDRTKAGATVSPYGLTLMKVDY